MTNFYQRSASPYLLGKILMCMVSVSLVGACASSGSGPSGVSPDAVIGLNADQIEVVSDAELASDPDLPMQDLDADTLEKLLLSNLASFTGQWDQATLNALDVARSSGDFRVARLATMLALRNDDYVTAAAGGRLWVELKPASEDAQNMYLLSLVGAGETGEAIQAIEKQAQHRQMDDYVKQLAALLVRQKNDVSGFAIASYLVEQYPDSAQVLLSSAYVAESFDLYEAAEAWVAKALVMRPSWDLAAQMKANLLYAQGKTEQRSEFVAEFVEANPKSVAMRINHAAELARGKDYQGAYQLILEVLQDAPNNNGALQYAGALAEALGQPDRAIKHYKRAMQEYPQDDDVRWSLARLAVGQEQYITAERLFSEIRREDLLFRASIQAANMRYETQGVDAAIDALWSIEPTSSEEWLELVETRNFLLMRALRYEEALGYINEAILYVPESVELLYARALVTAELNRVELAEQDFRRVIEIQPDHANALNALGYTLADQTDRYEEARELIQQALQMRPKDAHILDSMGWVLYRMQEYAEAIDYLQQAYAASPEIEIAAHLGEVLWESGETERATQVWEESFKQDSNNPVLNKTLERYGIRFPNAAASAE
ncbi:tetratricopeptide repeat protein [Arenicella xantha]|uniref:Tetratricopeptide repeat protein n=1 Tax=Arenicella xantha TaxID=644221 RepID=A0A395JMJ1_9GAMM|nr:tetratricopeptide repeat protein [Arenicella xantha]RBP52769.1 tetratricopeptide repeat protein [Arenicella xantha]